MSNNEPVMEKKGKSTRKAGMMLQQIGMNMVMVGLIALLAFLAWQRFIVKKPIVFPIVVPESPNDINDIEQPDASQASDLPVELNPLVIPTVSTDGIMRKTNLNTIIPSRPRTDVITYTVQTGDTLFSIAQNFNIKPETLLWGNFEVLNDNPHLLRPNQVLNVLPVNGTYYQWQENDTIEGVATFFKSKPEDIISFSGNNIDLTQVGKNGSGIEPGTWIIVPGGKRAIKDWGPPAITRQNPASARYYGDGYCGNVYEGAVGSGTFVWPTTDHGISGYGYDPGVHPAIDIAGQEGNPVYATDSGVVVYAGWSDYGYGLLIVIDHGNGWQSAYAHLSTVAVTCGQSVYQGGYIGALGTTGNSSGPHLHFELVINGAKVNPLDYTS
jgi:murein DD-endopeptidase MepM/ murein hydrolase activator NlpD